MEFGLIGHPVNHSFSPELHSIIGSFLNEPYAYETLDIENEIQLEEFLLKKDFKAVNVTIPYKQSVIKFLNEIDEKAEKIGAVNLILNNNGKLKGFNTDYFGFLSLVRSLGLDPSNKALILGSGGTSKTAFEVLMDLGFASVAKASRSSTSNGTISYEEAIRQSSEFGLIVNTTPLGMDGANVEGLPIDPISFPNLKGVIDVVYTPLRSNLIIKSESLKIPSIGGLKMLVGQGIKAAEIFLNDDIPAEISEKCLDALKRKTRNIVLVGMPTSGKTTLGKRLAVDLGRSLYDVDDLIEKESGLPADAHIKKNGETSFRDLESSIIAKLSSLKGSVIATGGGSILRQENVLRLKRNGLIYFIDRPLSMLKPSSDRPLSSDIDSLRKRYQERYPTYLSSADVRIDGALELSEKASIIEKEFIL